MGYIYKITNDVNGKMYVGKTEQVNPYNRWKEHLSNCNCVLFKNKPLYRAMNKYGIEHFRFEIIEEINNPEEICQRERYWINKLNTYCGVKDCNGYNATLGGDGVSYLNLDEKDIIRYHTEEACYVSGDTARHFNVDNKTIMAILLQNHIPWVIERDIRRLKVYQEYGGVYQVDIKTKIILNSFENVNDASIYLGKQEKNTNIYLACKGKKKKGHQAYGYLWYYGKDLREAIDKGEIVDIKIWA